MLIDLKTCSFDQDNSQSHIRSRRNCSNTSESNLFYFKSEHSCQSAYPSPTSFTITFRICSTFILTLVQSTLRRTSSLERPSTCPLPLSSPSSMLGSRFFFYQIVQFVFTQNQLLVPPPSSYSSLLFSPLSLFACLCRQSIDVRHSRCSCLHKFA
jgi:hypothetical protein